MIIGLDLATTSGIAIFYDKSNVLVGKISGEPPTQLGIVRTFLSGQARSTTHIVIEQHVYFRNAKTARSLMYRIGYTMWSLLADGYSAKAIWPYKARKHALNHYYMELGFDKDDSDALALIHEHLGDFTPFDQIGKIS